MATTPIENVEILRKILEHFNSGELLKLSFVNKQWNFEARSVLRGGGNVTAKIYSHHRNRSLPAFASDLEKMRVVPFSGIHVLLIHCGACPASPVESHLDPFYNLILDRLLCKRLSVTFSDPMEECKANQALLLVQKIMEDFCEVLEELSLSFEWGVEEMYEHVFPNRRYPRLRTLNVQADSKSKSLARSLKKLVSYAPNLREVNFNDEIHFEENVLEGSTAVLSTMGFDPLHERVCESLISSLRAQTVEISTHKNFQLEFELLNRAVPMVLQASHTSLKTLRMDLLFALPLMCYGICLENVTKLEIRMRSNSLQRMSSHIMKILKGFRFARVFPKLEQVEVVNRSAVFPQILISSFVERGNSILEEAALDPAANIIDLTLNETVWESALPFWAQAFPQANKLVLRTQVGHISEFPFTLLWKHFVNLEELSFRGCHLSMTANVDSIFCGIFPEEVAELMEKDDEYLKAVNIVPVMPSITCLTGLRTLTLDFNVLHSSGSRVETKPCEFLFSKVTALTGFARCPALAVTIQANSYSVKALRHMEPYVSFVTKAAVTISTC